MGNMLIPRVQQCRITRDFQISVELRNKYTIIMEGNMGLGPITGIPLPFMSYGRSAMLVNFISLGFCPHAKSQYLLGAGEPASIHLKRHYRKQFCSQVVFFVVIIVFFVKIEKTKKPKATIKNLNARAENGSLLSPSGFVAIKAEDHSKIKIKGKSFII